jgi:hypothetical protein
MRLQTYINEARKKPTFVRFGGLSKRNQKKYGISTIVDGFHKSPVNKGIYAFIHPYIEPFLFAWKHKMPDMPDMKDTDKWTKEQWDEYYVKDKKSFDKFYRENKKVFKYEGLIWTHFTDLPPKYIKRRKGSWVEVHTSDWDTIMSKQKHLDMKEISYDDYMGSKGDIKDPYKRGLGGFMGKDHLEVFIEKVN